MTGVNMPKIGIFVLIFFASLSPSLWASEAYSPDALIDMALKTHPNMKAYEQIVKGAKAQTKGAKWNYFPTPSASAYSTRNGRYGTTLALEQPIWTGGKIDAAYDMAVGQEKEAEFMLRENSYVLVEAVILALQSYIQFQESAIALQEGRDELKMLEAMLDRRIQAGVSPKSDMELLKSRLSQIEIDLNFAKTKEQTSLGQLALLTGRSFGPDFRVDETTLPHHSGSLEGYFIRMEETHPALKKISAQVEVAQAEKKKAKAVFWPNVSLRAEQQIGTSGAFDDVKNNDSSVYVSVQASPGAGLSAVTGIEQAEAKIMQLEYEKVSKKQDLMDAMMLAFNDYHSTSARIDPQESTINSSGKVMESYTRLFLAGKRQWLDLVNASRELTNNKMAFAELRATRLASAYRLALLRGDIVQGDGASVAGKQDNTIPTENFVPSLQQALVESADKPLQNVIVGESMGGVKIEVSKQENIQVKSVVGQTPTTTIAVAPSSETIKNKQTAQISKKEDRKVATSMQKSTDISISIDSDGNVKESLKGTEHNLAPNDTATPKQKEVTTQEYFVQVEANKINHKGSDLSIVIDSDGKTKEYEAGSLKSISRLKAKGIGYEIVEIGDISKVWAGPYPTKKEALSSLGMIRRDISKEAFIVQQN